MNKACELQVVAQASVVAEPGPLLWFWMVLEECVQGFGLHGVEFGLSSQSSCENWGLGFGQSDWFRCARPLE